MSGKGEEDLDALAEQIVRGEDDIEVPEQLIVEPTPPDPEVLSLFARVKNMAVGERIKLALKGNRDARTLLIRDPVRLVQRFVLQNPRFTEDEVLLVSKNRNTDSEILNVIGNKREWSRNYQVRLALVQNPKTPVATSLHFVGSLMERDMRLLAKSKNVSAAVASAARRLLLERTRGRPSSS